MTLKDLKRIIKNLEEETQTNWDDAKLYFKVDDAQLDKGYYIASINSDRTLFQNAPYRAIVFKD